jgi:hypothetical protein
LTSNITVNEMLYVSKCIYVKTASIVHSSLGEWSTSCLQKIYRIYNFELGKRIVVGVISCYSYLYICKWNLFYVKIASVIH